MNEKEKRIKEERTNEAIKKNLIGLDGKLGIILKTLGQPIVGQSIADYQDVDENIIPTILTYDDYGNEIEEPYWVDENHKVEYRPYELGWYFDGLSYSFHFEIKYEEDTSVLTAKFKGRDVYKDMAGDLLCYVPSPDWEGPVDKLYEKAKSIREKRKKEDRKIKEQKAEKNKSNFLNKLKELWGI